MLNSSHETSDYDKTALIGDVDVDESPAEALGYQGCCRCKGSVLLKTTAVSVTVPAEQMAPVLVCDKAPMPHGASVAREDVQSSQCLFWVVVLAGGAQELQVYQRKESLGEEGEGSN